MTVEQAAAVLGCDASHVRRLHKAGKIAGERIGKRMLLLESSAVERYRDAPMERGGWPRGRPRRPGGDTDAP